MLECLIQCYFQLPFEIIYLSYLSKIILLINNDRV